MTKQEITRDIKSEFGSFPSKAQIKRYLGCGSAYVIDLMSGIQPIVRGKAHMYYAGDVADRIMKARS